MDDDQVIAEDPAAAGVSSAPLEIEQVEPAHLLANDVRERLRGQGFDDAEIDAWADAFVEHVGESGTSDELVAWIATQERPTTST